MHAVSCRGLRPSCKNWRTSLLALALAALVAGCGGGGGSDSGASVTGNSGSSGDASGGTPSGGSTSEAGQSTAFNIEADSEQSTVGGAPVTLTVNSLTSADSTIEWTLAPGSPGSLSRTTGSQVQYLPPSGGSSGNDTISISATSGSLSASIVITLTANSATNTGTQAGTQGTVTTPSVADASAPGVYLVAGNDFGAGMTDGPGTAARFDTPSGVVRDASGNLYVADRFNNTIRKIDPQGNVSTFAGMAGHKGYRDAVGRDARFSEVSGLAIDKQGNLYVDDYGNALIRKITPAGIVTTLAGTPGLGGYRDGQGGNALLSGSPSALAVDDAGNLYVAETFDVRKITSDGAVTTLAGRSASGGGTTFAELNGIAVDGAHNVYVVDGGWANLGNHEVTVFHATAVIRRIAPDGSIGNLAGAESSGSLGEAYGYADGKGDQARFSYPQGMTIDAAGNLYVADRGNHAIRKITPDGVVTTVAGTPTQGGSSDGSAATATFDAPFGIVAGPDALYVTDSADHTVRQVVPGGAVTTLAGAPPRAGSSDGSGSQALFNSPHGVARDPNTGAIFVADTANQTIRRIVGNTVATVAGTPGTAGSTDGAGSAALFDRPLDVGANAAGEVFVTDFSNHTVRRIGTDGIVSTYAGVPGEEGYVDGPAAPSSPDATAAKFIEPQAVAVDAANNLYVADRAGDAIRKITEQRVVSTLFGHQDTSNAAPYGFGNGEDLLFPLDVAVDKQGNVYTIDSNSAIRKITPDGTMSTLAGVPFQSGTQDGTGSAARFNFPQCLTVDDAGNVYVGDQRAIRKITPQGVVTTVAGATDSIQSERLRNVYRPGGMAMTGPNTLVFTSGNGVFELQLP